MMTDLPINISNTPTKAVVKQTSNQDAKPPDGQMFGSVFARQMTEAEKPDANSDTGTSTSAEDGSKQQAGKEISDTDKPAESTNADTDTTLPANMLATLLAQPGQSTSPPKSIAQDDDNIQTVLNGQTTAASSTPGEKRMPADALAYKIDFINKNIASGIAKQENGAALPAMEKPVKDSKGLSKLTSTQLMPDINLAGNNPLQRINPDSGITTASILPTMATTAPVATANGSPMQINTPLTHTAWGDEFSQKVIWMATQRNQSAELHLNPPQLGPLEVVLKMHGDQATAMFTSPHAAVREAIEQAIPRLREMMADSGIMLGNAMVSDHSARQHQDHAARKAQGQIAATNGLSEVHGIQETRVTGIKRHNGMVDTFA